MSSSESIAAILAKLDAVHGERQLRASDAGLAERARTVREYQARRFRATYADLLGDPQMRPAALFFLNELYGEQDFAQRDLQFRRIVPGLVRLFPADVVNTVLELGELHALSEQLDTRMAQAIDAAHPLDDEGYARAWRAVGERDLRMRQIELVGLIGGALVRYTRHPTLGRALRMMRLPARAAGLSTLHAFLERGFDTFAQMRDPNRFLQTVAVRETELAERLFGD